MNLSPSRTNKNFYLRDIWSQAFQYWWVILLCAVIGAVGGYIWSRLNPPLYEASAILEVGVDYGRTEPMDAVVQQHALDRVRSLLLSDETLEGALILLEGGTEAPISAEDLDDLRSKIRLTERGSSWGLYVIDTIPAKSSELANAWAESAQAQLESAIYHAWRVQELQDVFFQVGCTLTAVEGEDSPTAKWVCVETQPEIDPDKLAQDIQAEANLSKGILPSFSFGVSQEARVPETPVVRGRGTLILAGAIVGGCLGLAASVALWNRHARSGLEES